MKPLRFSKGAVVDFSIKYQGHGLTKLLLQERELLITHVTEVRGNLFNKKETIDIQYLDISDEELSTILNENTCAISGL